MIALTKQERYVLLILAAVLFAGSLFNFVFKKYPQLENIVNLIDSDKLYPKVDINTATLEELISIPYIGDYTAQKIIEYRQENGRFTSIDQLQSVQGIKEKNFQKFSKFIIISPNERNHNTSAFDDGRPLL